MSANKAQRDMIMSEKHNHRRWNGQPGHYEVWYLTTNHRASETGFWIRYTVEAPLPGKGEPEAGLWFAFFDARDPARNLAMRQLLPADAMTATTGPFAVSIGESQLTNGSARGSLAGGGHQARWDLSWRPSPTTHLTLPSLMYRRGGLGETTVLAPNLAVAMSGAITVDDRTFELDAEPGGQTHLWGRKHAYSWAWGHCNAFAGHPGAAIEMLSVRLFRAGRVLPPLTILTLYLDGEVYRFNEFRHVVLNRAEYGTGYFGFSATGPRVRIQGQFSCRPRDMVTAPYVDPDGEPSWCANTEVADLRLSVDRRVGLGRWHEHAFIEAPRCGHFEVGGRTRDPAITGEYSTFGGH